MIQKFINCVKFFKNKTTFFIQSVSLVQENMAMVDSSINQTSLTTEARLIKDVVTKLNGFKLDHTEYTCLKALALFKPGKWL